MSSSEYPKPGIAIVGLGGCLPGAEDVDAFWKNICRGHVAIREVPTERWDFQKWYSEDRREPDKTYSRIGGFLDAVPFDAKKFRIPPRTLESVDAVQKLALTAVAEALADADLEVLPGRSQGGRSFDRERTAVILGNAMGGELEDYTDLRVWFPMIRTALEESDSFKALPPAKQAEVLADFEETYKAGLPKITEDSMPGELSNCIAGRVANAFDLRGPNFTCDAACAASMAAVKTAVDGLVLGAFDVALAGGVDRSMDPPTYVKFCKIGALSPNHSAPFDSRANGFVMGEGVGVMVLKRLDDAVRDGDKIYAVIRGVGAASDGKGKGMTAPNPRGQRLAVERAYDDAGFGVDTVGLFEAHGTSTTVGDATELGVLTEMLKDSGATPKGTPIGSVKSMIGHLKSAAGAASLVKSALALHHKTLPPSANYKSPTPDSPLHEGYLAVNTEARSWESEGPRRAGVSAFGFGGTNFHIVLEEHGGGDSATIRSGGHGAKSSSPAKETTVSANLGGATQTPAASTASVKKVLEEVIALFAEKTGYDLDEFEPDYHLEGDLGIDTVKQAEIMAIIRERYSLPRDESFKLSDTPTLRTIAEYIAGRLSGAPKASAPAATSAATTSEAKVDSDPNRPRLVVYGGSTKEELVSNLRTALSGTTSLVGISDPSAHTKPVRLAFGAQSVEQAQQIVDAVEKGRPRLLAAKGIFLSESEPLAKDGKIAFLFPGQGSQYLGMLRDVAKVFPVVADTFAEADAILHQISGGQTKLTELVWAERDESGRADMALRDTRVCQPAMLAADVALMRVLAEHGVRPDMVAGHSLGEYAAAVAAGVLSFRDALYAVSARGREMASVKVEDNGKMAVVAADAKRVDEVLSQIDGYVIPANKNCHTQTVIGGASLAVEAAVEKFRELGVDSMLIPVSHAFHSQIVAPASEPLRRVLNGLTIGAPQLPLVSNVTAEHYPSTRDDIVDLMARQIASSVEFIASLERMYADGARVFVEAGPRRACSGFVKNVLEGRPHLAMPTNHHKTPGVEGLLAAIAAVAAEGARVDPNGSQPAELPAVHPAKAKGQTPEVAAYDTSKEPGELSVRDGMVDRRANEVAISGVSVILPEQDPMGNEDPVGTLLEGTNFIQGLDEDERRKMLDLNIVRLNKTNGDFEALRDVGEVIQIAARMGNIDLVENYGLDSSFVDALDATSRLSIAAAIDALRDAGLPLVRRYRTMKTGKQLPDRWALPHSLARTTGVILGSAFPGQDRLIDEVSQGVAAQCAGKSADVMQGMLSEIVGALGNSPEAQRVKDIAEGHIASLREQADVYQFNRKFLFRILAMAHAQVAQTICAQGPNTQLNAACASGPQALGMAQDWILLGRCDRVVVVTADDVTSPHALPWFGSGFLSAGAATNLNDVSQAAVPFGRDRNGMILGAGASAFVVERQEKLAERGMNAAATLVATRYANSAFHGTRLDSNHIRYVVQDIVAEMEKRSGLSRAELAKKTLFMSHETYTPARGGSSAAEVDALRFAFGDAAKDVLIGNTKGYTGHPMATTMEDVVAVKGLQRQKVPAIANAKDIDPAFADLNLADGSQVDLEFSLRLGAGFGSQLALSAFRKAASTEERLENPARYQQWVDRLTDRPGAGLEIVNRTLRVAEKGGKHVYELGIRSLEKTPQVESLIEARTKAPETPAQPAVAARGTALDRPTVMTEIVALFAEQTGYDAEDFEPTYELEAELGIDTVKQAEIMGVVREKYALPKDEAFRLSDVQTLDAVVDYVVATAGGSAPVAAPAEVAPDAPSAPVQTQAPTPSAAPAGGALDRGTVMTEIVALFAEQTGYDVEDFEPSYELEAELGIDTVKQAEIMGVIREKYALPKDEEFRLSDVQTLDAVVDYVVATAGGSAPAATPSDAEPAGGSLDRAAVMTEIVALFAEQTGYDVEDFEPSYELEAELGIDTVKQAEIMGVIREKYALPKDEEFRLSDVQTLDAVVDYVVSTAGGSAPAASATAATPETPSAPEPTSVSTPAPSATPAGGSLDRGTVMTEIVALFAEQTGYDVEDFEPSYELEAELGIDTVKQAEIMGVIREKYALPKDEEFRLSDVQTLDAVVDYVVATAAGGATAAAPVAPAQEETTTAAPSGSSARAAGETLDRDTVMKEIVVLFAEQTGYDVEDFDPTYELEAELGIDTVKQAEIIGLLRDTYGLPRDESFRLSDVQTLNAVVDYVVRTRAAHTALSDSAAAGEIVAETLDVETPTSSSVMHHDTRFSVSDVVPVEVRLASPVASLSGRRVVLTGGDREFRDAFHRALTARGAKVYAVEDTVDVGATDFEVLLKDLGGAPADDLVFLVKSSTELDPDDLEAQTRRAFLAARALVKARGAAPEAGLLGVGRTSGVFGVGSSQPDALLMGALSGWAKTLAREWADSRVLAADLDESVDLDQSIKQCIDAWLAKGRPHELAWKNDKVFSLTRAPKRDLVTRTLPEGSVVVASGGARGVTYEILKRLVGRGKLKIVALARTEAIRPEDSPLHGLSEAEQKDVAKAAVSAAGERATPAAVRKWIDRQKARLEVAANLESLRQGGSSAELIKCDVSNHEALAQVAKDVEKRFGNVELVIHGAGTEESKFLQDKDVEAFERVFVPKASAALRMWAAFKPGSMLTMGSIAGRFGNAGQVDYAAANELMAALARAPERHVVNAAWTAWGDVGMATRGSVRKVLEGAGVELLPADIGAQIGADLACAASAGDVVVAGKLGLLAETELAAPRVPALGQSAGGQGTESALFDSVEAIDGGSAYVRLLDASRDVGLDDHRIEGTVVVAGVMGLEMMVQAAEAHRGLQAAVVSDVRFALPFKLFKDQPTEARIEVKDAGDDVEVVLASIFTGPKGKARRREHFSAKVSFGIRGIRRAPTSAPLELAREVTIGPKEIYERYFHGPRFQVLKAVEAMGENGIVAHPVAERPEWFQNQSHDELVSSPLLREAGFQAAGLWEMVEFGRMALPSGIARVELSKEPPADDLFVEVRRRSSTADGTQFDIWTRDAQGNVYDVMYGYHTAALRRLEEGSAFDSPKIKVELPETLVAPIDEVERMLGEDEPATLARFLSPRELSHFKTLKTDKRKIDWLAGRIAAKRLLRERRFVREDAIVPFAAITILADELGAPTVTVVGEQDAPRISISHSGGVAAAMVSTEPTQIPGIDVEVVEPRAEAFEKHFFHDEERAWAKAQSEPARALTEIWAVKEAMLKALGIGARVDLREVVVSCDGDGQWTTTLLNDAKKRLDELGAGTPAIRVEASDHIIMARVLLPVESDTRTRPVSKPESEVTN